MASTSSLEQSCPDARGQRLSNGIMVYGTPGETRLLTELVHDYPALWKDEGSVDIPVDEWMKLPLRSDWELKVSRKANVYPVGLKDP